MLQTADEPESRQVVQCDTDHSVLWQIDEAIPSTSTNDENAIASSKTQRITSTATQTVKTEKRSIKTQTLITADRFFVFCLVDSRHDYSWSTGLH